MVWNGIASLLWPARCAACNAFVPEGRAFCPACDITVLPMGRCCPTCAMPLDLGEKCQGCRTRPFPFVGAQAALAYGGSTTQALLRWKHGGRRHIAPVLAPYFAPLLEQAAEQGAQIACPVPLHPDRLRARGFNQALDLLRAARRQSRRRGLAIACDLLARAVDTPALGREPPRRRREIVAGAFAANRCALVAGRHVLVVDDVMTSGATLAECARVLLAAGARVVSVAALARAL